MLNFHFSKDIIDPSTTDFVRIAMQHITLMVVIMLLLYFLQNDVTWRKKSYA